MTKQLVRSNGQSPGFLNKSGTRFIDRVGIEWGWMDRIFNPSLYAHALRHLQEYLSALENVEDKPTTMGDELIQEVRKTPTDSNNRTGLSDEELEMMSGRFQPVIEHIGDARFTLEDIMDNGGLIPLRSNKAFTIHPQMSYHVKSGFKIQIPIGYMGVIYERKGMSQRGIDVRGRVIHHYHREEFTIYLKNSDLNEIAEIGIGEEIAQFAIVPIRTDFKII